MAADYPAIGFTCKGPEMDRLTFIR